MTTSPSDGLPVTARRSQRIRDRRKRLELHHRTDEYNHHPTQKGPAASPPRGVQMLLDRLTVIEIYKSLTVWHFLSVSLVDKTWSSVL